MSDLSRRRLITTGLAAAAGVSGLALRTNPTRSWRSVWRGRNADLCGAAHTDQALLGSRVSSQRDYETSVRRR
jgi:hypothetical protein